jgi:hypothetical protein
VTYSERLRTAQNIGPVNKTPNGRENSPWYLWRNILPHMEPPARWIAPDLTGWASFRLVKYRRYLDTLLGYSPHKIRDAIAKWLVRLRKPKGYELFTRSM